MRRRAKALHVLGDRRDRICEAAQFLGKAMPGRSTDLLGQLSLAEAAKRALGVVDDHHLARLHDGLRYGQSLERVACGTATGIPDDVGVTGPEPKQGADIDSSVHAGQDRQVLDWFEDAGGAPQIVEPRVHQDPVDGVHSKAEIYAGKGHVGDDF